MPIDVFYDVYEHFVSTYNPMTSPFTPIIGAKKEKWVELDI